MLKKSVMPFLILTMLPASSNVTLYSAEIKGVTIRNNKVKINLEKAKKIVFEHSKVHSNAAKLTKLILEKENKKYVYAIEFYYKNKKYKYNVDANTGRVITYSSSEKLVADSRWNRERSIMLPSQAAPAPMPSPSESDEVADIDLNDNIEFSRRENSEDSYYSAKFAEKEKNVEDTILEQLKQNVYDDLENASFEEVILVNAEKSIYKGTVKANYTEYNFKVNLSTGEVLSWKLKK